MVAFMAWPPPPSLGHSSGIRWYLRRGSSSMPQPWPKVLIGAYHLVGRLIPPNIVCHASKISMLFAPIWAEVGSLVERLEKGRSLYTRILQKRSLPQACASQSPVRVRSCSPSAKVRDGSVWQYTTLAGAQGSPCDDLIRTRVS